MKPHVKIYMDFFKYGEQDCIPCEYCGGQACDVHHVDSRGMGGSKKKDVILNLVAMCRDCHNKAERYPEINNIMRYRACNLSDRIFARFQSFTTQLIGEHIRTHLKWD